MTPADRQPVSPATGGGAVASSPERTDDRNGPAVTLLELASRVGGELVGDGGALVRGVRHDSRAVEAGDLFVALPGARADGARFVADAVGRGAAAVMLERGRRVEVAVPLLFVDAPRTAMARAAAEIYGRPTERLATVGITGTNGKTTTAHLAHAMLGACGCRPAIAGTLGGGFEDLTIPIALTSPECDTLQRFACAALVRGATHFVMEVSSIALEAHRVDEVMFAAAAFTNLTQDHLDYHGTMDGYREAKARLFLEWTPKVAVIYTDDPWGRELAERVGRRGKSRLLCVSRSAKTEIGLGAPPRLGPDGISLDVVAEGRAHKLRSPMVGDHNVSNLLVAAGLAVALDLDLERAMIGLGGAPPVPGRLEIVSRSGVDDVLGVVDYAHTPDALARVLDGLRTLGAGRIICVFGCGGDRDANKRGPMGAAVSSRADVGIVTNDNPRSEDPASIARAVVEGVGAVPVDGLPGGERVELMVELDRARAIDAAVSMAQAGDTVLVAGKGHETYQIIGDKVTPFDDRIQLALALETRRQRRGTERD